MQADSSEIKANQLHAPIAEAMRRYREDGALAFHTPGHKQGLGAHPLLRELITENGLKEEVSLMEELDDLHAPTGCIKEAEALAAELYGADSAYLMVNGTTGAIHAMLLGTLAPGDTVLLPRNAHRSLVGGLILAGARPVWLAPETNAAFGIAMGVPFAEIERQVTAHPEARAVVLVYPTYYGVTVDLAKIADFVHAHGMLLLVDEAHGPHLKFSDALPPQAIDCGADAAAQSTHKILGAMTQGSLLLTKGNRIDHERVRAAASLLLTTSPNQLLMASIDIARLQMAENGRERVSRAVRLAENLRQEIAQIPGLRVLGEDDLGTPGASGLDATKLTVNVRGLGLTGPAAERFLRYETKIECELSDADNVLFIISYADTEREAARLLAALRHLAAQSGATGKRAGEGSTMDSATKHDMDGTAKGNAASTGEFTAPPLPPVPETALAPRDVFFAAKEAVPFDAAVGRIAAEQVMFYPPGIPLLVPGDRVTRETLDYLAAMQRLGRKVVGPADLRLRTILCVKER